jgi:PhnB protein
MALLNPYLTFTGNAREAIEFYKDVFGGELNIMTFGDMGAGEHEGSPIPADGVMHAQLTTDQGFTLMASDPPPGDSETTPNGHISLSGDSGDGDLLRGYFDRLAEGGHVDVPLEKAPWGDEFGQVKDRFGVNWLVNIAGAAQG